MDKLEVITKLINDGGKAKAARVLAEVEQKLLKTNNHIPLSPPANMANPCSGSDVAASAPLPTLRAAVVQRPLVASKMSTALL
jgi:hypothetical protein